MKPRLLPRFVIFISLFSVACSSSPPVPVSEQRLADARSNLKASDFNAGLTNLDFAIKSAGDDPVGQQAVALRAALATALADAGKQMAEAYAIGAKEPAAQARYGPFSKMRLDYYGIARAHLMNAMQSVMDQRRKLGANPIPIQVSFPGFTGGTDPTVTKIKNGQWVPDNDRYAAELLADRNALARILTAMAGGGLEPNKGQQIFAGGKVDIDPRVYLIELSSSFMQIGGIFEPRALNEPDHFRIVTEVVQGNLEVALKLLAAKPDKDMEARVKKMQAECEKTLKKFGL
jgi:hypothetical protein